MMIVDWMYPQDKAPYDALPPLIYLAIVDRTGNRYARMTP